MGAVTLKDIRLNEYNFVNLPLLKQLRAGLLEKKPEVCIERARYFTKYLEKAPEEEPAELRYANAVNYFLSEKAPLFFDDNLLAGTTTSKTFGAPVYPEFATGLAIWPELDTIKYKKKESPDTHQGGGRGAKF